MSNYLPRHTKKKEHLEHREQALLRALKQGQNAKKIVDAAEEVRAAALRVIEARRATVPPCEKYASQLAKLEAESHRWASRAIEQIIAEYRGQLDSAAHRAANTKQGEST